MKQFPGQRILSVIFRSIHIISMSTLLIHYSLQIPIENLVLYWHITVFTGFSMLLLDLLKSFKMFHMLHMWFSIIKVIFIILAIYFFPYKGMFWLIIVFMTGFMAHAPRTIRHYAPLRKEVLYLK